MRIGGTLVAFLVWLTAFAVPADLYADPGDPPPLAKTSTGNANGLLLGAPAAARSTGSRQAQPNRAATTVDRAVAWIWAKQREFHRALTRELRALRGQQGVGWALVLMSFLYGLLHAAGPGHGKAVLTTYLLTHRNQLHRGIAMGTSAALLQGVTALLLVYGLIGLAGWLPRETEAASLWATRVSFALLAVVGLYLLVRAVRGLINAARHWRQPTEEVHHDHADHAQGESCGCRHLPNAAEIDTGGDRRATAGVVLAIGLRPCTGAVLVLILASVMGLAWQGALAVLAMSLGTALTIVILAVLATKAREWASALVAHRSPLWVWAGGGAGALGGAVLLTLGLMLLSASFAMKSTMGL
jgi:ABC-type nickel/cobalt efflux system permease component RcnA